MQKNGKIFLSTTAFAEVIHDPHQRKLHQAQGLLPVFGHRQARGAFQKANPGKEVIRLGIGDVTEPLPPACIKAFHKAVDEMAEAATFHGYGPEQGYDFLRETIAKHDFQARGADIEADEIFVTDGAKCDNGNIQEIFATDITVAIPDPVYPVYVDTNVMAGRTGAIVDGRYAGVVYLDCTRENGFIPSLPRQKVDLIYLCFPNNPTGGPSPSPSSAVGGLCPAEQGHHPLRRRLRGLHPRRPPAALHL